MGSKNISDCINWWLSTDLKWLKNSYLKVDKDEGQDICLTGNKQGLLSLSKQLQKIVRKNIPVVVYDEFPGDLEEGSLALTLKRLPNSDFGDRYQSNGIVPNISLNKSSMPSDFIWLKNSFLIVKWESKLSVQVAGNRHGLLSFSNHLQMIVMDDIPIVSYEKYAVIQTRNHCYLQYEWSTVRGDDLSSVKVCYLFTATFSCYEVS